MLAFHRGSCAAALLLLVWFRTAALSAPTATEKPEFWPYHSIERGAASSRVLALPTRDLTVIALRDEASFRRFWMRAHLYRDSFQSDLPVPPPPRIDFHRSIPIAVIGRAGSADIHVQKMWTAPDEKLVLGAFNPIWSDVPMRPDRVPYEMVVALRSTRHLMVFERPGARALALATRKALAPLHVPESSARALTRESLAGFRRVLAARGRKVLTLIEALGNPSPFEPHAPYIRLLRASVLLRLLDNVDDAWRAWREVIVLWPGTELARIAKSRLLMLERRPRDYLARKSLDAKRAVLSVRKDVLAGHARRWLELGGQYEYLFSQSLESLYVAARCYIEAARDPRDADRVQNALLQAAAIYEQYFDPAQAEHIYWQCLLRFPAARSVPQVLEKLALIGWELGRSDAEAAPYRNFVARFPNSPNAAIARAVLDRMRSTYRHLNWPAGNKHHSRAKGWNGVHQKLNDF